MEITLLPQNGLRIKGKKATLTVDKADKTASALLLLQFIPDAAPIVEEMVTFNGPGEYEVGGVKISGFRSGDKTVYSMTLDGTSILVGSIQTLTALQSKLKEHNIVIALCDGADSATFLTNLGTNVIMFYGEKAEETSQVFPKEKNQVVSKYTTSLDKLPQEVETIVLS